MVSAYLALSCNDAARVNAMRRHQPPSQYLALVIVWIASLSDLSQARLDSACLLYACSLAGA